MTFLSDVLARLIPGRGSERGSQPHKYGRFDFDNGNRAVVRRRQRLSEGFIWSEAMLQPRPCNIRDLTALGCRIDLWDDIKPRLLRKGVVIYSCVDRQEMECELMWRRDKSLGLRFTSAPRSPTRVYGKI